MTSMMASFLHVHDVSLLEFLLVDCSFVFMEISKLGCLWRRTIQTSRDDGLSNWKLEEVNHERPFV